MNFIDMLFLRKTLRLTTQTNDSRPYLSSRFVRFSYNSVDNIQPAYGKILVDTGAKLSILDSPTTARIVGVGIETLNEYLEYLSTQPPGIDSRLLEKFGHTFEGPVFIRGFTGLGRWTVYLEKVNIIIGGKYLFTTPLFTAYNTRPIFGIPFLKNMKLILDRDKERSLVIFQKNRIS